MRSLYEEIAEDEMQAALQRVLEVDARGRAKAYETPTWAVWTFLVIVNVVGWGLFLMVAWQVWQHWRGVSQVVGLLAMSWGALRVLRGTYGGRRL